MMNDEKFNTEYSEDEEEIIIDPNASLIRVYDTLPYTPFRIKRILKNLGYQAENIYQGYKANRVPEYCEKYRLIRISDGEIINPKISLDGLRKIFAGLGYPLEDEKSLKKGKKQRNQGAEQFLAAVSPQPDKEI